MDAIGIHAVFGGFLLGAVMPRGLFAEQVRKQLEPFTVVVLLPLFFTYSGLNTQLTAVDSWPLLLIGPVVLAGSVLAKFGACWAAARLTGQDNATALGIGALMNARGLMELIIINIGLQRGPDRPGAVLHPGADGHRHHPDGLAPVRARLWPQGPGAGRTGRSGRP